MVFVHLGIFDDSVVFSYNFFFFLFFGFGCIHFHRVSNLLWDIRT